MIDERHELFIVSFIIYLRMRDLGLKWEEEGERGAWAETFNYSGRGESNRIKARK